MATHKGRLSERYDERVEKGGRRELERRRLTRNYFGEGGRLLSRQERHQLFAHMASEPSGQMMTGVLVNRQKEHKMEGTPNIPQDFWDWAVAESERMLGHPLEEGAEA